MRFEVPPETLLFAVLYLFLAQLQPGLDQKLQSAEQQMAAGRFREAIPLYAVLVKGSPSNARLLMSLGLAQQMAGDSRSALSNLEAALRIDHRLFPANLYLGIAEMTLGRPAAALQPLRNAVALEPSNAAARQALADALGATGNYKDAVQELRLITEADPSNTRGWYALGRAQAALAAGIYQKLLSEVPADSAFALAVRAEELMQRQQFRRSFALFQMAISKDPALMSARAALAEIYRSSGHPEWAAKERELLAQADCTTHKLECDSIAGRDEEVLAATTNKQTPSALYWRAQAYTGLAYRAFEKLEQLPPSRELYRFRAGIEHEAGHRAQVVEQLRKALAIAPHDQELRRDLGMALGATGDYQGAYRIATELLRDVPDSPDLNALAGDALLNQNQAAAAIPFLKKSISKNPGNPVTHASLARAYMLQGQAKLALPHFEAAVIQDADGSLHYQLAHAYQQTGRPDLAQQAMAKYQELSARAVPQSEPEITHP